MDIPKHTRDNLIISALVFIIVILIFVAYHVTSDGFEDSRFQAQIPPSVDNSRSGMRIVEPADGMNIGNTEKVDIVVITSEPDSIVFVEALELRGAQQVCSHTDRCVYTLNTKELGKGVYSIIAVSVDSKGKVYTDKVILRK